MVERGATLRLQAPDDAARRSSIYVKLLAPAPYLILFFFVGFLRNALRTGDIWVRMAAGRLVVRDHIIPRTDPFSFSVPGHSWIDHEWVLGAVLYLLNSLHYEAVVVVFALLGFASLFPSCTGMCSKGAERLPTIAVVAIAMACAWRNYPPRPALVNPEKPAMLPGHGRRPRALATFTSCELCRIEDVCFPLPERGWRPHLLTEKLLRDKAIGTLAFCGIPH